MLTVSPIRKAFVRKCLRVRMTYLGSLNTLHCTLSVPTYSGKDTTIEKFLSRRMLCPRTIIIIIL